MKQRIRQLIPQALIEGYHYLWALTGALRYRWPSRELIVIGVTGTKGKTTLCALIHSLLQGHGIRTALSSSESFRYGDEIETNTSRVTMPGRWFLQRFLREAVDRQCEVAIIEVTSEGLMQHRHAGIDFDTTVFLNLHPEHIEHHGGYERYREAKGRLFQALLRGLNKHLRGKLVRKTIVANLDDREASYFLSFPAQQKITFALSVTDRDATTHLVPDKVQLTARGASFSLGGAFFTTQVVGRQNLTNVLAALATIRALDLPFASVRESLATFVLPEGRFEIISARGFRIVVDYAHTPNSIEALYENIFELLKPKRLVCVIGSTGGLRDKWKRPVIGEIAARYCSEIIITNEDPFDEDPRTIMRSIERGVQRYLEEYAFQKPHQVIEDRREAIRYALSRAEPGDAVVLIGKGSERTIETAAGSISWHERTVVEEELAGLNRAQRAQASAREAATSMAALPVIPKGLRIEESAKLTTETKPNKSFTVSPPSVIKPRSYPKKTRPPTPKRQGSRRVKSKR